MSVAFDPCPKCDGSGDCKRCANCEMPCPHCGGLGVLITEEMVLANARGFARWPELPTSVLLEGARAGLVRLVEHLKDRETR